MKPSKEAIEAAGRSIWKDSWISSRSDQEDFCSALQAAYAIDFAQLEQQLREAQKELSSYQGDVYTKQHISELEQSLSTLREENARLKARAPHMCRDEHVEIWHRDSSSEMCPLCRERASLEEATGQLKVAQWGNDEATKHIDNENQG